MNPAGFQYSKSSREIFVVCWVIDSTIGQNLGTQDRDVLIEKAGPFDPAL
jgi:hypothetical protein